MFGNVWQFLKQNGYFWFINDHFDNFVDNQLIFKTNKTSLLKKILLKRFF